MPLFLREFPALIACALRLLEINHVRASERRAAGVTARKNSIPISAQHLLRVLGIRSVVFSSTAMWLNC
jgi:hypothetical protein